MCRQSLMGSASSLLTSCEFYDLPWPACTGGAQVPGVWHRVGAAVHTGHVFCCITNLNGSGLACFWCLANGGMANRPWGKWRVVHPAALQVMYNAQMIRTWSLLHRNAHRQKYVWRGGCACSLVVPWAGG
jgi:hypothetical protein